MFDRCVVINLAKRTDRMERFWNELPAPWPFVGIDVQQAIDGTLSLPPESFCPTGARVRSPDRHRGAWGCLRSHLRVMEDALCGGADSVLVFEDDAIFGPRFAERAARFLAEVPSDWDQIYLGGQHLGKPHEDPERINDEVIRCKRINRTHAYAIRGEMLLQAYRTLSESVTEATFDKELHIDHRLGDMHATGEWNVYAPVHWMVGQRGGISDVAVTGRRLNVSYWDTYEDDLANA